MPSNYFANSDSEPDEPRDDDYGDDYDHGDERYAEALPPQQSPPPPSGGRYDDRQYDERYVDGGYSRQDDRTPPQLEESYVEEEEGSYVEEEQHKQEEGYVEERPLEEAYDGDRQEGEGQYDDERPYDDYQQQQEGGVVVNNDDDPYGDTFEENRADTATDQPESTAPGYGDGYGDSLDHHHGGGGATPLTLQSSNDGGNGNGNNHKAMGDEGVYNDGYGDDSGPKSRVHACCDQVICCCDDSGSGKSNKTKIVVGVCVIFAIVAVAVGVSVGLTVGKNDGGGGGNVDSATDGNLGNGNDGPTSSPVAGANGTTTSAPSPFPTAVPTLVPDDAAPSSDGSSSGDDSPTVPADDSCSLCGSRGGTVDPSRSLSFLPALENVKTILDVTTCGLLEENFLQVLGFVGAQFPGDADGVCNAVQQMGVYCGCNSVEEGLAQGFILPQEVDANGQEVTVSPCSMCALGTKAVNPGTSIENTQVEEMTLFVPNCTFWEDYIVTLYREGTDQCDMYRSTGLDYCQCPDGAGGANDPPNDPPGKDDEPELVPACEGRKENLYELSWTDWPFAEGGVALPGDTEADPTVYIELADEGQGPTDPVLEVPYGEPGPHYVCLKRLKCYNVRYEGPDLGPVVGVEEGGRDPGWMLQMIKSAKAGGIATGGNPEFHKLPEWKQPAPLASGYARGDGAEGNGGGAVCQVSHVPEKPSNSPVCEVTCDEGAVEWWVAPPVPPGADKDGFGGDGNNNDQVCPKNTVAHEVRALTSLSADSGGITVEIVNGNNGAAAGTVTFNPGQQPGEEGDSGVVCLKKRVCYEARVTAAAAGSDDAGAVPFEWAAYPRPRSAGRTFDDGSVSPVASGVYDFTATQDPSAEASVCNFQVPIRGQTLDDLRSKAKCPTTCTDGAVDRFTFAPTISPAPTSEPTLPPTPAPTSYEERRNGGCPLKPRTFPYKLAIVDSEGNELDPAENAASLPDVGITIEGSNPAAGDVSVVYQGNSKTGSNDDDPYGHYLCLQRNHCYTVDISRNGAAEGEAEGTAAMRWEVRKVEVTKKRGGGGGGGRKNGGGGGGGGGKKKREERKRKNGGGGNGNGGGNNQARKERKADRRKARKERLRERQQQRRRKLQDEGAVLASGPLVPSGEGSAIVTCDFAMPGLKGADPVCANTCLIDTAEGRGANATTDDENIFTPNEDAKSFKSGGRVTKVWRAGAKSFRLIDSHSNSSDAMITAEFAVDMHNGGVKRRLSRTGRHAFGKKKIAARNRGDVVGGRKRKGGRGGGAKKGRGGGEGGGGGDGDAAEDAAVKKIAAEIVGNRMKEDDGGKKKGPNVGWATGGRSYAANDRSDYHSNWQKKSTVYAAGRARAKQTATSTGPKEEEEVSGRVGRNVPPQPVDLGDSGSGDDLKRYGYRAGRGGDDSDDEDDAPKVGAVELRAGYVGELAAEADLDHPPRPGAPHRQRRAARKPRDVDGEASEDFNHRERQRRRLGRTTVPG